MPKLRVHNFAISIDGYGAGPNQSLDNPLGEGGKRLHDWAFTSKTFREHLGMEGGESGINDDFVARGNENIGATIMGRNMFGPIRGEWSEEQWNGWWGDNPPYHHATFVLTHHARPPLEMEGGTTFYFVDDGIESALKQAFDAADGKDVRIGGGVQTVQEYLRADLVDEMHIAIAPIVLGSGESLFEGIDITQTMKCTEFEYAPGATHVVFVRK